MRLGRALLLSGIFWWLSVNLALASPLLTEVHPNPLSGPEWVELYNPTAEPLSLTGWLLEDQLSSPSIIFNFTTQVLSPGTYLHFELPTQKLNNTSDGVTLKNPQGQVVDSMSYTSSSLGESWSRNGVSSHSPWALSLPTPSQANPQPTPIPTPSPSATPIVSPMISPTPSPHPIYQTNLQASEIMACPATGDSEWLEIFNPNSSEALIDNWRVKDETGNIRTVSAQIPAQGYGVVSWSSSLLNNAGDSLSLVTPNDQSLFTIDLGACQKGQSFIFTDDEWHLTTSPTKGTVNYVAPLTSPQSISTPPVATLPRSSPLTTVSATPAATLSPQKFAYPHPPAELRLAPPVDTPFVAAEPDLTFGPAPDHTQLKWPVLSVIMGSTVMLAVNSLGVYYLLKIYNASFPAISALVSPSAINQSPDFP